MRLALALSAAGVLLALASPANAASNLAYGCQPPLPGTAASCSAWHTVPVTLLWSWNQIEFEPAPIPGSDCTSPRVFSTDTAGTAVHCYVWGKAGGTPVDDLIATVRVDMTPPAVTSMTPARPPDHDGWWNHPVSLAFAGTDATSGIAGCDTVDYAGPDSDAASVTGSCRDVAGNSASGTFPFKYDASPPTLTPKSSDARKAGRIALSWTTSDDAVSSRVVRSPGVGGAPASELYSGANRSFTDSSVRGGKRYTYAVSASDPAGNVASTTMTAVAKKLTLLPRLRWRPVKGAHYYNVQLFRNGRKILSAWPRHSRLQLRKTWRYGGKRRTLTQGTYRWYVWPGFGAGSAHRYGKLITQKKLRIG